MQLNKCHIGCAIAILMITLGMTNRVSSQSTLVSTDYFEFHNDYWINLHHFLYQRASGSQVRKLAEDGYELPDIGEDAVVLTEKDQVVFDHTIQYYSDSLASKNLRRDLGDLRIWFQTQSGTKVITDTSFSKQYTDLLNGVSVIYKRHYWPIHKQHNERIIAQHIDALSQFEDEVIAKMETLAEYKWPDVDKVRVDLTAYANYAGAYTAARPQMNIVISTIDPLNNTSSFIETVYHEGSHLLFNYQDSPFRGAIYDKAEELGMEFPRGLWHAAMFYLSGRATQDALKKISIEHGMELDVRNIFANYNTSEFRRILEAYYLGQINLNEMATSLLESL